MITISGGFSCGRRYLSVVGRYKNNGIISTNVDDSCENWNCHNNGVKQKKSHKRIRHWHSISSNNKHYCWYSCGTTNAVERLSDTTASTGTNIRFLSSSKNQSKKGERVILNQTPRAKAAAKIKLSSKKERRNGEVIKASNQEGLTKFAELQQEQHDRTHYVKGGTPCDPAQPPFKLSSYGPDSLYTLVLLRHGESEWNSQNRYTGWCDVNLTERGVEEAKNAGKLLHRNGVQLDHAFTSVLKRACHTANWALDSAHQHWVPLTKSWRLNERHYGALQGYGKDTAYQDLNLDQELVMEMRRSYLTRPPIMEDDHPYWHGNDRRYKNLLSKELLDNTRAESLHDAAQRVLPFYRTQVVPSLRAGNKCLIVSHANTLRSLIKHIDGISDQDIKSMSIPTGIPMLYRLDRNMKPVDPHMDMEFRYMVKPKGYTWATAKDLGFHGVYLGDLERLQDIQLKRDSTNRDWQRIILRNIASQLNNTTNNSNNHKRRKKENNVDLNDNNNHHFPNRGVIETRQLWWRLHTKITEQPEYQNMVLLQLMKDKLESIMIQKHRRFITISYFDTLLNQIHTDATGKVVQPFVSMTDEQDRQRRAKEWDEMMTLDAEDLNEECLIK